VLLLTGGDGLQEAFASFSLYLGRGSIDDANDESDDAEHDGERSEAFSAFVSGKGEKQQYGNERDKGHVTWHPFNLPTRIGYLHPFGGHETPALDTCT